MADITIPYSSDFTQGGDQTNQVLDDLLRNQTTVFAWLNSLRRRQRSASPPSNPNEGDIWECSTTGGGYTADVVYRYNGSAWAETTISALNIPNRNCVIQGAVDGSGNPVLFAAGTGLSCDLAATTTPCVITWMGGNNGTIGAVDIIDILDADAAGFWSSLPQNSTVYLYIDYASGTVTGSYSTIAPVYQNYAPSHSAGKHWIDYNKGQVWSSDGASWTQRYRVFVGTATTDGAGVTAVSVYPYNVLRQDVVGDVTGNASTATVLETARAINGVDFNGSAAINVPFLDVRQTVLSSSVDASGYPNFISAGAGLSVSIAATTVPVVLTAANGFGAYGPINLVGRITADTSIGSLTNTATNYLYADIAADGSCTLGATTLAPTYQFGGTYSTTNGQFTFNICDMIGKVGNGSVATQTYRVFIGEAVTAGGAVTSVVNYGLRGQYVSPATLLSTTTTYPFNYNGGMPLHNFVWQFFIKDVDNNWYLIISGDGATTNQTLYYYIMADNNTIRNVVKFRTTGQLFQYTDAGGTARTINAANKAELLVTMKRRW
jgi:hypothetical protein